MIPDASADDSEHTTTLGTATRDYGDGNGTVPVVYATINSNDDTAKIRMELNRGSGWTVYSHSKWEREPGGALSGRFMFPTSGFASGTVIRAHYLTYDGTTETFSYSRDYTMP